jgi:hypothetical protein
LPSNRRVPGQTTPALSARTTREITAMTAALAPVINPDPPPPHDGMRVSEADYWAFYYEGPEETYEWNNGVLEEKGVSDHLTFLVYDWFLQLLIEYLRAHPIAERVGLETGFRLSLPAGTAIRRPDYALILHDNPRPIAGLGQQLQGHLRRLHRGPCPPAAASSATAT